MVGKEKRMREEYMHLKKSIFVLPLISLMFLSPAAFALQPGNSMYTVSTSDKEPTSVAFKKTPVPLVEGKKSESKPMLVAQVVANPSAPSTTTQAPVLSIETKFGMLNIVRNPESINCLSS